MDATVVIVSWNTREILRDCLQSVFGQTKDIAFEVIVVDNHSQDGSVEMVRKTFPQARVIANTTNRGFAAANNQGIDIAEGRYVLLLNSDTVVLDGAIQKIVAFADARPEAGVFGCRVLNSDRTLQPTCFMYPSLLNMFLSSTYLYKLFPRNRFFGRERMTWWDRSDEREVEVVTGCFIMVRRKAIDQVGLLDENFFMYGEETDWCWRFNRAGWKVLFTPESKIIHIGGQSSRIIKHEMHLQIRASILLFLRKHRSRFVYHVSVLFVSLFYLIRLPYWLLVALLVPNCHKEGWQTAKVYGKAVRKLISGGWTALEYNRRESQSQ